MAGNRIRLVCGVEFVTHLREVLDPSEEDESFADEGLILVSFCQVMADRSDER